MCGRFQLDYEFEQLLIHFDAKNNYVGYGTRKEIFPTDTISIITRKDGHSVLESARWGLDNHFDKRPLINARGETVDEKRTFKSLLMETRCIIPATAFFEWKTEDKKKTKYLIKPEGIDVFGMAGLYKVEVNSEGVPFYRCAIITIGANEQMAQIHERMPVILSSEGEEVWLDTTIRDPQLLKEFIRSYDGNLLFTAV